MEGVDDEHPICIPDITIAEFDSLLRFFYFGYDLPRIRSAVY